MRHGQKWYGYIMRKEEYMTRTLLDLEEEKCGPR